MAKSGFGGTEYLLPALVSEGTQRGMGYNHMARVTSWNPAQRFGLNRKGDIAEGFDADIALVDPARTWTIRAKDSPSTQGYTPFEGLELSARVDATFLRGKKIYDNGQRDRQAARRSTCIRPTSVTAIVRAAAMPPARRGAGGHRRRRRLRADRRDRPARRRQSTACCSSATPRRKAPPRCRPASSRPPARAAARGWRATTAPSASPPTSRPRPTATAAPHLVRGLHRTPSAQRAGPAAARHGLRFELLDGFLYPGHWCARMHTLPERTGAALMAALERAADASAPIC